MHPHPTTQPHGARKFWLVWLATIALAASFFEFVRKSGPLWIKPRAFRQTARGWQDLPPSGSFLYELQISESGAVWARTARGLERLIGGSWRQVTNADLGSERAFLPVCFALDKDDVWAAATGTVAHFDGRVWTPYPNPAQPTSIVARQGEVWGVDRDGRLAHFDGARWTIRKILIPVNWAGSRQKPQLAITPNGALWLVFQGLWRYDGQSWNRIHGAGKYAQFLGVTPAGEYYSRGTRIETGGALWVRDGFAVLAFNVYGSLWARYWAQDLSLPDSAIVDAVAGRPPVVALASSRGVTWFDGSRWRAEQLPLDLQIVTSIALDPDLSIWGVAHPPASASARFKFAVVAFALLLFVMMAIFYPLWRAAQTGRLPGRDNAPRRSRAAAWIWVIALGATLAFYFSESIARRLHLPGPPGVAVFLILVGFGALVYGYEMLRGLYVERELKAGRYQHALEIVSGPLRFPTAGLWSLLHAEVLFYSGRATDAEIILRELLASARGSGFKAAIYENLGQVLMAQGRYPEAEPAFQSVAALMPGRSTASHGLAELCLRQGMEPEQALGYAERALRLYRASALERRFARERLAAIRGNQAWALAILGRAAEALKSIKTARADLDPGHIPETAAFHWRAGMTMLALGENSAAEIHFHQAARLDRAGYYGKLAAHQLGLPAVLAN